MAQLVTTMFLYCLQISWDPENCIYVEKASATLFLQTENKNLTTHANWVEVLPLDDGPETLLAKYTSQWPG